ncbi:phosphatase 1 regulatory subunit 11-like protein [Dermatophagoides farinae]|uniref:Phosphatase 1 regulatory subunit 11-like protein n=1 Tax=Dermatophagoides farinae TaxID=6954 RepID=A0A9D4P501_DERFA|nr:phosphatase 1 regulatory subunit 11-like protein [Dermatophagoides farinae]
MDDHLMEIPSSSSTTVIITEQLDEQNDCQEPSLKIKLKQSEDDKTKNDKKVKFTEGTIDNEHLNLII